MAQLAAHSTCNRAVPGSSPGVGSTLKDQPDQPVRDAGQRGGGHVAERLDRHPIVVVVQRKPGYTRDLHQRGAVAGHLQQPIGDRRVQLASAQRRPAGALGDVGEGDGIAQHLGRGLGLAWAISLSD